MTDEDLLNETVSYRASREGRLAVKSDEVVERLARSLGWQPQPLLKLTFQDFASLSLLIDKKEKEEFTTGTLMKYLDPAGRGDIAKKELVYWLTQSMGEAKKDTRKMMGEIVFSWLKQNGMTYHAGEEMVVIEKFREKSKDNALFFRYLYELI